MKAVDSAKRVPESVEKAGADQSIAGKVATLADAFVNNAPPMRRNWAE
jgi:hypothetical protein